MEAAAGGSARDAAGDMVRNDLGSGCIRVRRDAANAFHTLAIPLVAAVAALLPWPSKATHAIRIAAALASMLFVVVSILSVGVLFLPSSFALYLVASQTNTATTQMTDESARIDAQAM